MNIIILGAGVIGTGLAEYLINENNDITLVDTDMEKLTAIQNRYDIKVVNGFASYPATLREADAANAELVVAVTNSDETNMLACQFCYSMFHVPQKIARIQNNEYLAEKATLFNDAAIPIDSIIAPEQLITDEIVSLVEYPGANEISEFSRGRLGMVGVTAYYGGPMIGHPVKKLHQFLDNIPVKVMAIYRQDHAIPTNENTVIEAGDEIYFVATKGYVRAVISKFQKLESPFRRIMIIGGNRIGQELAKELSKRYSVKIVETDPKKAHELSKQFSKSSVAIFNSAPSNSDFLTEEHIDKMDLIISVTEKDETNIMSAMLAKNLGARRSIVLISKFAYINLIKKEKIDIIISPREATISALLTNIRHNGVGTVHTFRRGESEGLEIRLIGDLKHSAVIGRRINEISFPPGIVVAAISRDDEIFMAQGDFVLRNNDNVIFYIQDKKNIRELLKLTTPKATYFSRHPDFQK